MYKKYKFINLIYNQICIRVLLEPIFLNRFIKKRNFLPNISLYVSTYTVYLFVYYYYLFIYYCYYYTYLFNRLDPFLIIRLSITFFESFPTLLFFFFLTDLPSIFPTNRINRDLCSSIRSMSSFFSFLQRTCICVQNLYK